MKNQLSVKTNQALLQKRKETVLSGGQKLTSQEEQTIWGEFKEAQRFIGILPLESKLGTYFFLNLNDDNVAKHLFLFGCFGYERSSAVLFTHLAMKADYVVDLGAYSGYYSVLSSVLANNSRTYSVEANPLNFHRLCENLRVNGSDAIPYNYAIVPTKDIQESITIYYNSNLQVLDTGTYASHELAEVIPQKLNKQDKFLVSTITFSALLEKLNIHKSNDGYVLIKLDIEGLELPLLEDICDYYHSSDFVVLMEVLTQTAYDSVFDLIGLRKDLSMAYIHEHDQTIQISTESSYMRNKGSRNFILGSTNLLEEVCNLPVSKLLGQYE